MQPPPPHLLEPGICSYTHFTPLNMWLMVVSHIDSYHDVQRNSNRRNTRHIVCNTPVFPTNWAYIIILICVPNTYHRRESRFFKNVRIHDSERNLWSRSSSDGSDAPTTLVYTPAASSTVRLDNATDIVFISSATRKLY